MPSSATGGGFTQPSQTTAGLKAISSEEYPFVNKDFVKNIAYLNQATDSLAAWAQTAQSGIDNSNKNFLDQIQGVFADLMVLIGGGEPTGLEIGDFKYILKAMGALLGINPDTPFPLNLVEAMTHIWEQYLLPLQQLTDLVFDSLEAWAEHIGMSDDAITSIEDFSNAVSNYHHDKEDLGKQFDIATQEFFQKLKLKKRVSDNTKALEFWDNVGDAIDNVVQGVRDTLLNILSDVVVVIFKSMTWAVNAFNPRTALESFGIEFLGPELVPAISSTTNVWSVGSDANTGWVFDNSTSHDTSAGSFKTNGNATNKRILTAVKHVCATDEVYNISGFIKWSSIPVNSNDLGLCLVFYNNNTEVDQHNIDIKAIHGESSDWIELTENINVPTNANGFKVGARITSAFDSGVVWVDELSALKQLPLGEGAVNGILTNIPIISDLAEVFSGVEDGNLNDIGTWVNKTVSDITTVWDSFFGKHQNGPSMVLDPGFDSAAVWQYEPGVQSTDAKMDGVYSRKLTGPSQQLYFTAAGINNRNSIPAHGFRCVPRQKFTISCYARRAVLNGPLGQGFLGVILYPGTGAGGQDIITTSASMAQLTWLPSIWVNLKVTYTVPDLNANNDRYTHIVPFFGTSNVVGQNDDFYIDELSVKDVTENQDVINAITAALGSSGTDADSVQSALEAIPGGNIGSTVNSSVIPGLDASVITTGSFAQSQITNLGDDLTSKLSAFIFDAKSETGANLVYAPTFDNSLVTRYAYGTLTTSTYSIDQKHSGIQSYKITVTDTNTGISFRNAPNNNFWPVSPADVYYCEVWVRAHSANNVGSANNIKLGADCYNSITGTLTLYPGVTVNNNTISTSSFTKISGYITMPTNCDRAVFYLWFGSNFVNNIFYVDDVTIREVTKASELNAALYGAGVVTPATTVIASAVPSIDASKVTTGTFGNALIASGLDAAKLTKGTLPIARIGAAAVTNTYLGSDIAGSKIASAIGASIVPALDAAKITTGTFGNAFIATGLDAAKVTTGTLPGAQIPALDAAKITTGTFANAMIASGLDAAKLTTGTLPVARIGAGAIINTYLGSDIAGSKIASAILAAIVPSLDASKITTGTLGTAAIPNVTKSMSTDMRDTIDNIYQAIYGGSSTNNTVASVKTSLMNFPGGNIVSAILAAIVPSLDATKITTGTLGTGQIPALDAAKITTGTFGNALIASGLDATKLTTGTLPIARIAAGAILNTHLGSDLDASKLTAGTLPVTRIGTGAIVNAYLGSDIAGSKIASAILAAIVPSLDASKITTGTLGTAAIPNVTKSMSTDMRDTIDNIYQAIYGGSSTNNTVASVKTSLMNFPGANIVSAILAAIVPSLDATKITTGTLGTGQIPSLDAAKITTGTFGNALIASGLDAAKLTTGTMPVARIAANAIVNAYLGSDIAGSKIASAILAAIVPSLDASKITTGTLGNALIASGLDAAKITTGTLPAAQVPSLDASKITSGTVSTAQLPSSLGMAGSGVYMRRTAGGQNVVGKGPYRFLTAMYDGTFSTSDIVTSTDGSGQLKATATYAGWYMVEVAFGIKQSTRTFSYSISPAVFINGTLVKIGVSQYYYAGLTIGAIVPTNAQATFIVNLAAGDYVSPGSYVTSNWSGTTQDILSNDLSGDTYFSISLLNRSLS